MQITQINTAAQANEMNGEHRAEARWERVQGGQDGRIADSGKGSGTMRTVELFQEYMEHLFQGKRCEARELMMGAQDRGIEAAALLTGIVWKAMEQIDKLYRENQISRITEHMATRINRLIADQLQGLMAREPKNGKRVLVVCGEGEAEELGAQMTADLFESKGWSVWFLGAGVPNDETVQFMGRIRPDVLCIYGTVPAGVPGVRRLVDLIREIGGFDQMQVLTMGGVFNRAEGLSDEVHADLTATDALEALAVIDANPVRVPRPDMPQPGRRRKRKQRPAAKAAALRTEDAVTSA